MLKNRILYGIGLFAALMFLLWSWVWIAALVMLITLLLPLLSWLLTAGLVKKISYDIEVPSSVSRGSELSLVFVDRSEQVIPDYAVNIEVEDCTGEKSSWIAELNYGERRAVRLGTEHCGAVRCVIKSVYAYDYLGLFRFRLRPVNDVLVIVKPVPAVPSPLPVLSQINHSSYRPKYGGGFSEVHDMREYRPGDSIRDIHWKLSAKTDRLIVREPQLPDRGIVLLTIDMMPPSDVFDLVLDRLLWISRWLCANETEHEVRWISPETREVKSFTVNGRETINALMRSILCERADEPMPPISNIHFSNVDWHYHIGTEVEK